MSPLASARARGRDLLLAALLALLPALAYSPAWSEGRLLGPGEGAALHYPLRAAVWLAYRQGQVPSWNGSIFSGMPLLPTYPAGSFFPLTIALAPLPPFDAFQLLVLLSLAATAVLTFAYVRTLGAGRLGAYVSALCFVLGPYLVDHLGDTATIVALPALLLALLALEYHLKRRAPARVAALAAAAALLLLAGSPEAAKAGAALLFGRLLLGHAFAGHAPPPPLRTTALALAVALLLAAPQLLPTLLAARDAGPPALGPPAAPSPVPGLTGLVLRYVSHSPAPALVLAALPLLARRLPARMLGLALAGALLLERDPRAVPAGGGLALILDFALAVLAGLSLDAQWRARGEDHGRRLRTLFFVAALASAAALSVAATVVGPLPQTLAGSVGVLALAMTLYFTFADSPAPLKAGLFVLPLTASFLLQPHGRQAWARAPLRTELERGTPTREAIDRALGPRRHERLLTLVRHWPAGEETDLAYAGLAGPADRRSANGFDPFAPRRTLLAWDGMSAAGTVSETLLRSDPVRLRVLGIRWVQVPTSALTAPPDADGFGDPLDLPVDLGRPRFFPLPITTATEVRLSSALADAAERGQGELVALATLRSPTRRELPLPIRAGLETAEWAHDRPDVHPQVRHDRAPVLLSFREPGWEFEGHRYRAVLKLPGRYALDGLRLETRPGPGRFLLFRLGLFDAATGRTTAVSLVSGALSDTLVFREAAATPGVRLFEVRGTFGPARVVDNLRRLPDEEAIRATLRAPTAAGLDPRREALIAAAGARFAEVPAGSRASRAELVEAEGGRLVVRAMGPGLLVVTEGWDGGWEAEEDGQGVPVLRVNGMNMGIALGPGTHLVRLRHRARGLLPGLALAATGAALLLGLGRRI